MRVAVADVGTNSTHLMIAEAHGGDFRVLDALKVRTRLGECLDGAGNLTQEGEDRLADTLLRFRELSSAADVVDLRVYATSALREAPNGPEVAARMRARTSVYPVIISGEREGRLTYLGAAHSVEFGADNLLLDLGGGSLELARGGEAAASDILSLPLGAIRMTDAYLTSDPATKGQVRELQQAVTAALEPYLERFRVSEYTEVFLSSGTAEAAALALASQGGLPPASVNGLTVTVRELGRLIEELRPLNELRRARIPAFERRARTIVGGLVVLHTALEALGVREVVISEGALREGMMVEELHRNAVYASGLSARQRSALALTERFGANLAHARTVADTAADLYNRLLEAGVEFHEGARGLLRAAATLHEVGQLIAQSGHHKHSAYLIRHGGLRGFTPQEIEIIAQVARYHRRSLPKMSHPEFAALSAEGRAMVCQLGAVLRVADGLDRSQAGGSRVRRLERRGGGWRLEVAVANALDLAGAESKGDLWEREFGPLEIAATELGRLR